MKRTILTDSSLTVQTKAMDPVIVYTVAETKYERSGAVASMKDLKIGDRVVSHAARINDKLVANEVHVGTSKLARASR